jgi:hypothetical protein
VVRGTEQAPQNALAYAAAAVPLWDRQSLAFLDPSHQPPAATDAAHQPAAAPEATGPSPSEPAPLSSLDTAGGGTGLANPAACAACGTGGGAAGGAALPHPSPRPPSAAPPDGAPSFRPRGSIRIISGTEAGGGAAPRSPAQPVPAGLDAASRHSMEQAVAPGVVA